MHKIHRVIRASTQAVVVFGVLHLLSLVTLSCFDSTRQAQSDHKVSVVGTGLFGRECAATKVAPPQP